MSLDSNIFLDADASPEDIRRVLRRTGHFEDRHEFDDLTQMTAEGVILGIHPPPSKYNEAFDAGINANLDLFITCTDHEFSAAWDLNGIRATVALLHEFRGDLLFVYLDIPALMRKGGRIILDRRASIWEDGVEPNVLSLIDLPYEFGTIPTV